MDKKLRRWLQSRCRARPDGGWLVEVPVFALRPAPAFVLPDEATKEAFLVRAARLGRVRLLSEFALALLADAVGIWFFAAVVLAHEGRAGLWVAAVLASVVLVALRYAWVRREGRRFRAWLDQAGEDAVPGPGPAGGGEQETGWWSGWRAEIKRCRPGWTVFAEAAAHGTFLVLLVLCSFALRPHCRRALAAWWKTEAPLWPAPDGCFNLGTAMLLGLAAWSAVGPALAVRDWWRWDMRRW